MGDATHTQLLFMAIIGFLGGAAMLLTAAYKIADISAVGQWFSRDLYGRQSLDGLCLPNSGSRIWVEAP